MEKILNELHLGNTSTEINKLLGGSYSEKSNFTRHYSNSEDFFIKFDHPFTVPSFPIHHDVSVNTPEPEYISALTEFFKQIIPSAPEIFKDLIYFFDPTEIFFPCFYQVFKFKDKLFLYLVRIDLSFRPNYGELIKRGTNDKTNSYTSKNLFMECDIIPLNKLLYSEGRVSGFVIDQYISQTWIGETGRGYFAAGIWIDMELTKYISRIFVPPDKHIYPYYPYTCKYRTVCHTVLDLSPKGRRKHLVYLQRALNFLKPVISDIQDSLKKNSFTPELPQFKKIKNSIPSYWDTVWKDLKITMYLNDLDIKEFSVEF